jgi:Outer membrane protein beta-barrel domain
MRKRIPLSILAILLSLSYVHAQTEKSTFTVGLNASPKIIAHRDKDNNRMEFHWELQGGYFVKRNWLLGGELSYTRFRVKSNGEINHESDTYRLGVFTRKYFDIGKTKWKPFVGLSGGYAYKSKNELSPILGEIDFKKGGLYANAEVGIAYFIKNQTSLHISNYLLYDFLGDKSNYSISLLKIGVTHNFGQK